MGDFLTFGVIVASSIIRGMLSSQTKPPALGSTFRFFLKEYKTVFILFFMSVFIWPVLFLGIASLLIEKNNKPADPMEKHYAVSAQWILKWLGAILLGVIILLAINSAL